MACIEVVWLLLHYVECWSAEVSFCNVILVGKRSMKPAGSTCQSHEVPWIEFVDFVKLSRSLPSQTFGTGQAGTKPTRAIWPPKIPNAG